MADPTTNRLKILAVCDEVDPRLYSSHTGRVPLQTNPDLILSCGDLPSYYLDYLVSKLDAPMYAVHGNHDASPPREGAEGFAHCGADWVGGRGIRTPRGVLLAGFDGCMRYNNGAYQSTEAEMRAAVHGLVPWLMMNRVRYGRYLDVLMTHAPPRGIHDERDRCHTGFDAYNWLIHKFKPRYHLHGHIHVLDRRTVSMTRIGATDVINVYPFRELELELPGAACASTKRSSAASHSRSGA
jgi:Icc-related predicted phosphoesterase